MPAAANTMASQTIRPTVCDDVERCDMVVGIRGLMVELQRGVRAQRLRYQDKTSAYSSGSILMSSSARFHCPFATAIAAHATAVMFTSHDAADASATKVGSRAIAATYGFSRSVGTS